MSLDWRSEVNSLIAHIEIEIRKNGITSLEFEVDELVKDVSADVVAKLVPAIQQVMGEDFAAGRLGRTIAGAILGAEMIRQTLPKEWSALTWCLSTQGRALQDLGHALEATKYWRECLEICEKNSKDEMEIGGCNYALGLNLLLCREFAEASTFVEKAIRIFERNKLDGPELAAAYAARASIFAERGENEQALWWFASGRQILESLGGHDFALAQNLVANGKAHLVLGDYEESLRLLRRAIALMEKAAPRSPLLALAFRDSADVLTLLGRKEHAKKALIQARKIEASPHFPRM